MNSMLDKNVSSYELERRKGHMPAYRKSAERDHMCLLACTFAVGAILGAVIALGVMI